jgi:2-dehydropantoate 2-reductase
VGDEIVHARPKASHDPAEVGVQDVVIVTVKGPSLTGIVDNIKTLLDDVTAIIFAMNGIPWWYFYGLDEPGRERRIDILDPGNRWWNEIGPERAVGGVVYSANTVVEPGVVRANSTGRSRLLIGEPNGSVSKRCKRINAALDRAGLANPVVDDIRHKIWAKLLGNIAFAPVCTLTSATIADVISDAALRTLCIKIMGETVAVADTLGIQLNIDLEKRVDSASAITAHRPSMLQDFDLGRPMEIPSILLTPQTFGRMADLPTPYLDTVIALLKQRARSAGLNIE